MSVSIIITVTDEALVPLVLQTSDLLAILPEDAVLEINSKTTTATIVAAFPNAEQAVEFFLGKFGGSA